MVNISFQFITMLFALVAKRFGTTIENIKLKN